MPTNAFLVRWNGGWREALHAGSIATYGRREACLGLGAAQSIAEVDTVAAQQLAIYADIREAIAADIMPIDDTDTPYLAFRVGDTINVPHYIGGTSRERVIAITGSEDEEGNVTYAPELRDVILEEQERQQQAIDKMIAGTMGGTSKVATPASYVAPSIADCCPPTPPGVCT